MAINMTYIIQNLINYALLLSVHLLIILLLRKKVCQWFGAVTAYKLWLLPFVCLPLYLVDWSFLNSLVLNNNSMATGIIRPAAELVVNGVDVGRLNTAPTKENYGLTLWSLAFMTWLAGVMVLTGIFAYKSWKFSRFIREQATFSKSGKLRNLLQNFMFPARLQVIPVNGINSPALYGFMHPALLVPVDFEETYDEDQRHIMLTHESIHFQRRDNLWSMAASITGILFWFNPLVYLAYPLFRLDQELSCDALTLRHCNSRQRRLYPRTLVESADLSGIGNDQIVVSSWNNLKDLKERTLMLNKHPNNENVTVIARGALLLIVLGGSAFSFVFAGNAPGFTEAEIIPGQYLPFLSEDLQNKLLARENPRNPVPTDSDHLVILIDSSGSMYNYSWDQAVDEVRQIFDQYSDLQAFQIINDMGQYVVPEKRREWIAATDNEIESVLNVLTEFTSFSNSSPIEGFNEIFDYLVEPSMSTSIFVLGDELVADINPEELVTLVNAKASGARIHTKMFPVYFTQPERFQLVARHFADAMVEIAELTEASFEIIEMDYSFPDP